MSDLQYGIKGICVTGVVKEQGGKRKKLKQRQEKLAMYNMDASKYADDCKKLKKLSKWQCDSITLQCGWESL